MGKGVSDGVTPGGKVGLDVSEEMVRAGPAQLARMIAIPRPKSTDLIFMEMLITRDGKGVNVFYFVKVFPESEIVNNFINMIMPIEFV